MKSERGARPQFMSFRRRPRRVVHARISPAAFRLRHAKERSRPSTAGGERRTGLATRYFRLAGESNRACLSGCCRTLVSEAVWWRRRRVRLHFVCHEDLFPRRQLPVLVCNRRTRRARCRSESESGSEAQARAGTAGRSIRHTSGRPDKRAYKSGQSCFVVSPRTLIARQPHSLCQLYTTPFPDSSDLACILLG